VEKIWESKNSGVMVEDLMKEFLMHVDLEYWNWNKIWIVDNR
jgi:hypothetical protein